MKIRLDFWKMIFGAILFFINALQIFYFLCARTLVLDVILNIILRILESVYIYLKKNSLSIILGSEIPFSVIVDTLFFFSLQVNFQPLGG